jgi:hypothetical protein
MVLMVADRLMGWLAKSENRRDGLCLHEQAIGWGGGELR